MPHSNCLSRGKGVNNGQTLALTSFLDAERTCHKDRLRFVLHMDQWAQTKQKLEGQFYKEEKKGEKKMRREPISTKVLADCVVQLTLH